MSLSTRAAKKGRVAEGLERACHGFPDLKQDKGKLYHNQRPIKSERNSEVCIQG